MTSVTVRVLLSLLQSGVYMPWRRSVLSDYSCFCIVTITNKSCMHYNSLS